MPQHGPRRKKITEGKMMRAADALDAILDTEDCDQYFDALERAHMVGIKRALLRRVTQ